MHMPLLLPVGISDLKIVNPMIPPIEITLAARARTTAD
jgi:hypothetical protein